MGSTQNIMFPDFIGDIDDAIMISDCVREDYHFSRSPRNKRMSRFLRQRQDQEASNRQRLRRELLEREQKLLRLTEQQHRWRKHKQRLRRRRRQKERQRQKQTSERASSRIVPSTRRINYDPYHFKQQ